MLGSLGSNLSFATWLAKVALCAPVSSLALVIYGYVTTHPTTLWLKIIITTSCSQVGQDCTWMAHLCSTWCWLVGGLGAGVCLELEEPWWPHSEVTQHQFGCILWPKGVMRSPQFQEEGKCALPLGGGNGMGIIVGGHFCRSSTMQRWLGSWGRWLLLSWSQLHELPGENYHEVQTLGFCFKMKCTPVQIWSRAWIHWH